MRIAIAGYNGFIGKAMVSYYRATEEVVLLPREVLYNFDKLSDTLQNVDVVLNFAGFSISNPWNRKNREEMQNSRIEVTRNIVKALRRHGSRSFLVNASGTSIYSQEGIHSEDSTQFDTNFLSTLVVDWENEVKNYDGQFAILRLGVVLGEEGGLLPVLRKMVKYLGGWAFGTGQQNFAAIHIRDVVGLTEWTVRRQLTGVFNAVMPESITWTSFIRLLCTNSNRAFIGRIPGWILRTIKGSQSILFLADIKVVPLNILNSGYKFRFPTAKDCVNDLFLPKN